MKYTKSNNDLINWTSYKTILIFYLIRNFLQTAYKRGPSGPRVNIMNPGACGSAGLEHGGVTRWRIRPAPGEPPPVRWEFSRIWRVDKRSLTQFTRH